MKSTVLLCTIFVNALATPNGFYQQEYNYRTSSSAYKNNELQHRNDDEGFYSKAGDLEGRVRPRVNAHSQHSEYVNPKLQHGYQMGTDRTSSFGQLHAQDRLRLGEPDMGGAYGYAGAQQGYAGAQQSYAGAQQGYAAAQQSYSATSDLRQVTASLQQEMERELQRAVFDHHQRAQAYGGAITQAQIEADRRSLEEDLRRNMTMRLQEALKVQYGNQGVRGAYSYSIINGRLQPTANYNNQELAELTRQMEENLLRHLNQQVQTHYHTRVDTQMHTQRNTYRQVNGAQDNYPSALEQRPVYHPQQVHPEIMRPQPVPMRPQPVPMQPHPVAPIPDSITTVATRVQTELNEILNKILEDTQRRYFSENSYNSGVDYDRVLVHLQDELRANITFHFDDQIKRAYGYSNYASKYSVEDIENLRRQIEANLITKLNRDYNRQREKFFQSRRMYVVTQPLPTNQAYYPVNNANYQSDIAETQRQLQEQMSRQLQSALTQHSYRQAHMYSGSSSDFNAQAQYQTTLQQLAAELNRNLTRQMETLSGQQYQNAAYASQLANMRNQLQGDLMRQLQQGLQQSYSRYSSWSSSSSSSSSNNANYRPVRGYDPNLYRNNYGTANVGVGEDCMMGDDPSVYQQHDDSDEDLTQQVEDLTQQSQDDADLTQQTEDLTQQTHDDLTQQVQTHDALTQQSQDDDDLTQQTQDLTQQSQTQDDLDRPIQQAPHQHRPRVRPLVERITPPVQRYEAGKPQQFQQQTQTHDDLTQQTQDLTQQTQDLTQQSQAQDISDQRVQNVGNYGPYLFKYPIRPPVYANVPPVQRYEAAVQLPQEYRPLQSTQSVQTTDDIEPIYQRQTVNHLYSRPQQRPEVASAAQTQQVTPIKPAPYRFDRYRGQDLTQQTQDLTQQTQDLSQQTQDLTQQTQDLNQQTQAGVAPSQGQQTLTQTSPNGYRVHRYHTSEYRRHYESPRQYTTTYTWTSPGRNVPSNRVGQRVEYYENLQRPRYPSAQQTSLGSSVGTPLKPVSQQEEIGQQTEDSGLGQTQDLLGQQTENDDLTQQVQNVGFENIITDNQRQAQQNQQQQIQQSQDVTQQSRDLQDLSQQSQDLTQQNQDLQDLSQQSQDLTQQSQDLTQQTQDTEFAPLVIGSGSQIREKENSHYRHQPIAPSRRPVNQQTPLTQQQAEVFTDQQNEDLTHRQTDDFGQQTDDFPRQNEDLTQQTEDLTQQGQHLTHQNQDLTQSQDLTQQVQDLTQQTEDLTQPQQNQYLTQQTQDLTQQNQDLTQSQDLTQQTQDLTQQTEDLTQQNEDQDLTQQTQDLTQPQQNQYLSQQTQDLTQETEDIDQPIEPQLATNKIFRDQPSSHLAQQTHDLIQQEIGHNQQLSQQTEDLTQQTEDLGQQSEDLTQQNQDLTQQSKDLTQQTQDLTQQSEDLTQQNQDLTQQNQDLTQQSEDLTQQNQDLTQSEDLTQQNQDLTQQSEDLTQQSEDLTQQNQDLTDEATTIPSSSQQNKFERLNDAERESQRLIDLLRNQQQNQQIQQNYNNDPVRYTPKPVYGDHDGHPIQVGTTRHIQRNQQIPDDEDVDAQEPEPVQPYQYKSRPVYSDTHGQIGTTRQLPNGRNLNTQHQDQVNYARELKGEPEHVENVSDIEPIQPQVASEVQQVDGVVEPITPEEAEVVTTTPKPGFWTRFKTSIKNKIG